jgi:hypothetical protein
MPRVAGHFCLVYLVNVFADLQIAQFLWVLRADARKKPSSLNLNAARQNFEAKKFLNPQRQIVHLFVGLHAAQSHISCVLLLRQPVH